MFRHVLAVGLASSFVAGYPKTIGHWQISGDKGACYVTDPYDGDAPLTLVTRVTEDVMMFMMSSAKWTAIQHGKKYKLIVEIDRRGHWNVNAIGSVEAASGYHSLAFVALPGSNKSGDNFLEEFATGKQLVVRMDNGEPVERFALHQSRKAIVEGARCVEAIRREGGYRLVQER